MVENTGSDHAISRLSADRWLVRAMDTVFSIVVPALDADDTVRGIASDWSMIEQKLSVFLPDSEISSWRRGEILDDQLSVEVTEVIAACDWLEAKTDGLFSPHQAGGYDPTGYVKGWALSRAAARLDQVGIASYCVNGGGDIIARGTGSHGVPWRVGIAHPNRAGELATVVTAIPGDGSALAVATSGTSERGQHVVNPINGWRPARSSVTVVGHDIALVDAIATAALAAGSGASAELVGRFGCEALGFDEAGFPWWTPGMADYALLPHVGVPQSKT